MIKKVSIVFIILIIFLLSLSYSKYANKAKKYFLRVIPNIFVESNFIVETPMYIINDSIHYFNTMQNFIVQKKIRKSKFKSSKTQKNKNILLKETSNFLYNNLVDSLIPYWYGTPWNFNGISQKPGSGNIACGYFVFTVLRDVGFKIPRIKMSQAASEQAIKSLVSKTQIKRYSNKSLNGFITEMNKWGKGVYIVGLDNHVGLLLIAEQNWFIHSTAYSPRCVIKEKAEKSLALEFSSYRVVGKLSNYNSLTKKWIFNEEIKLE